MTDTVSPAKKVIPWGWVTFGIVVVAIVYYAALAFFGIRNEWSWFKHEVGMIGVFGLGFGLLAKGFKEKVTSGVGHN